MKAKAKQWIVLIGFLIAFLSVLIGIEGGKWLIG